MKVSIPNRLGSTSTAACREFPYKKLLLVFFLLSLPMANPTVHGDGVGYYAYARALLIQHDLRFEEDWRRANTRFSSGRVQADDQLAPSEYTPTGYVDNHFTVGPAILWSPFLIVAHLSVLLWNALGGKVSADGFSAPYLVAMAVGTAWWGFLALLLSFSLAQKVVRARWAFLATMGIWLASSLPVYMYFNPSWSHAHSAFAVALFVWFWERTRNTRTMAQWIALGLIAGLMIDVYFPNSVFLALVGLEGLFTHYSLSKTAAHQSQWTLAAREMAFGTALVLALVPTLITRAIIYGGMFRFGAYTEYEWDWRAPHWLQVLFASDHGALSWTPILALALLGLFAGQRESKTLAIYFALCTGAFYYVISTYPYWDGMASFGNRFFISLTSIFVFGLALLFEKFGKYFRDSGRAFVAAAGLVGLLAAWNAGFIFQWGEHLIPVRGDISFREMTHNQVFVVPRQVGTHLKDYLFSRRSEMRRIEERDMEQLGEHPQK